MRWIYTSITICTILVIWSATNIMWSHQHYQGIIKADGKGYYAHLPAAFIYHDLNFGFFDSIENGTYQNANYFYDYRKTVDGKTLNKYFGGTSVAMLPFFALGHAITSFSEFPTDGYSKYYQISIGIAAIFYMVFTFFFMAKAMLMLGYRASTIAWAIPILLLGTNYYYYLVSEPAMSHVYSIFFITLIFFWSLQWSRSGAFPLLAFGLVMGLIIFIRPVNAMAILLVPLAFKRWNGFLESAKLLIKLQLPRFLFAGLLGFLVVFLQLLIYKIQTGNFLVYSYEEEGFNFLHPQFFNILFSYKKGLFLYTPLLLISLFGVVSIYRKSKWQAWSLVATLFVLTYVLSSWWNWYYGGSFSSRAYIEYYVLFFWLIVSGLDWLTKQSLPKRISSIALLIVLIGFCQLQTFQYRHNIIHWDNMTKEKYWSVFLKIKKDPDTRSINP